MIFFSNYSIKEIQNSVDLSEDELSKTPCSFTVNIVEESFEEWLEDMRDAMQVFPFGLTPAKFELDIEMEVQEVDFVMGPGYLITYHFNDAQEGLGRVLSRAGRLYLLGVLWPKKCGFGNWQEEDCEIFDTIFSTFKFID